MKSCSALLKQAQASSGSSPSERKGADSFAVVRHQGWGSHNTQQQYHPTTHKGALLYFAHGMFYIAQCWKGFVIWAFKKLDGISEERLGVSARWIEAQSVTKWGNEKKHRSLLHRRCLAFRRDWNYPEGEVSWQNNGENWQVRLCVREITLHHTSEEEDLLPQKGGWRVFHSHHAFQGQGSGAKHWAK